ncbi:hypothetical protein HKD37_19G053422 [Glycine soja]
MSSCKKSRALVSLRALRQAARLTPDAGRPSSLQDLPPASSVVEAPASAIVVAATPASLPPLVEATLAAEVDAPATSTDLVVIPSPTITAPLLSAGVTTISAPEMPPPPSSVRWGVECYGFCQGLPSKEFGDSRENGQRHQEVLHKEASLEAEVAKLRVIACTVWRVEHPMLPSKVGGALAKLLRTRMDDDELFEHCKGL